MLLSSTISPRLLHVPEVHLNTAFFQDLRLKVRVEDEFHAASQACQQPDVVCRLGITFTTSSDTSLFFAIR